MAIGRFFQERLRADINLIGRLKANHLRWAIKNTEFCPSFLAI
jgi:hypothetical protein